MKFYNKGLSKIVQIFFAITSLLFLYGSTSIITWPEWGEFVPISIVFIIILIYKFLLFRSKKVVLFLKILWDFSKRNMLYFILFGIVLQICIVQFISFESGWDTYDLISFARNVTYKPLWVKDWYFSTNPNNIVPALIWKFLFKIYALIFDTNQYFQIFLNYVFMIFIDVSSLFLYKFIKRVYGIDYAWFTTIILAIFLLITPNLVITYTDLPCA